MIFKKPGKQKLRVMDISQDIAGEVTIDVADAGAAPTQAGGEIQILTPVADGKVTTNTLLVSGTARKNSKIELELNGQKVGSVVSDTNGLFTHELPNITQENNILKASLIDAAGAVIATSPEVKFVKTTENSSLYGVAILPSTTAESGTGITIHIDAAKGLASVTAMLDNSLLTAKEISEGKYQITTNAPQKEGQYDIDVTAKTLTNQETSKSKMATLTVIPKSVEKKEEIVPEAPKPSFKDIKTETKDAKVMFTFAVENAPSDLHTFQISYASGAVTTHPANSILKEGKYSWYIDRLSPGPYTFYIQGKNASGALIEDLKSEPLMATIGVPSCTISNVGKITIKTDTSKSVLTWDAVKDANKYNVYKIGSDGKYNLITSVTEPSYTLFLSQGAITYDDFAIKAVCADGTESSDYSGASKVQTGPGLIAFIVIISGIVSAMILRRRT